MHIFNGENWSGSHLVATQNMRKILNLLSKRSTKNKRDMRIFKILYILEFYILWQRLYNECFSIGAELSGFRLQSNNLPVIHRLEQCTVFGDHNKSWVNISELNNTLKNNTLILNNIQQEMVSNLGDNLLTVTLW